MKPETNNEASEAGLPAGALFACGTCPECGHLQPTGTFTRQPHDKAKEPFRVVFSAKDGKTIFVESNTIQMARAAACGSDAKILSLANV